jgi:hypothetical protein
MASPVNVDIKIPLRGDGWIQVRVHVTDMDDLAAEDEQFVLELVEKVRALASDMQEAGLLTAGPEV